MVGSMSFRLSRTSVRYLRSVYSQPRQIIRYSSSVPTHNEPSIKENDNTPVQKTVAATKAYLEKIQSELKPRLDVYLTKVNQATEQVKKLTSEVHDSKEALQRASKALNQLTGYDHIDQVKQKVNNQALLFEDTRDRVQEAKRNYEEAIELRSHTQRGINELLQRKHLWTSEDVTHFTELYRLEHSHSQAEQTAKETYQASEKQMDREYMELARSIMERYHEEQLWSDKIRSVSTYGTWALMVVNLLLFVTVQTVFEPRKRKRLTDRFEELLVSTVNEEEEKFKVAYESLEEKDQLLMQQQRAIMDDLKTLTHQWESTSAMENRLFTMASQYEDTLSSTPVLHDNTMDTSITDTELNQTKTSITPPPNDTVNTLPLNDTVNIQSIMPDITTTDASEEYQYVSVPESLSDDTTVLENVYQEQKSILNQQPTHALNYHTVSNTQLALYSLESAIVGGLMTALAVYFYR